MGKSFRIWDNDTQEKAPYLCTRKPIDMKAFLTLAALLTAASCSAQNTQTPEINQNTTLPMNQTTITLNNGVVNPQFGLGVYSIPAGETTYNSVLAALKAAYRHIDTAHAYQNERSVGQAVKDSGIPREEIWITSNSGPRQVRSPGHHPLAPSERLLRGSRLFQSGPYPGEHRILQLYAFRR